MGIPEIAVIAGVTALIFGPSKLPELGKAAGETAKSFQEAAKEFNDELKKGMVVCAALARISIASTMSVLHLCVAVRCTKAVQAHT